MVMIVEYSCRPLASMPEMLCAHGREFILHYPVKKLYQPVNGTNVMPARCRYVMEVSNTLLVLSITRHYYVWGCMCSAGPFQFRWLKGYIYSSFLILIKSEVSILPIVIIFFHGCVPDMFVTSYSVTYCIYPNKNEMSILIQFLPSAHLVHI